MSDHHPYGKPINIVQFTRGIEFIIEYDELNQIFSHHDIKYRNIIVFSIVGAFRKGKSFLLDYVLRFLYANYPSINYPDNPTNKIENWMGEEDEPLKGFSWRSGASRDTSGIVMWSDVFLHTVENTGEKLAIVVMDTQGLFDNETTPEDNSRIFALGTLISSIQVLNLLGVVQEDQLQYLQFATEFAKFAAQDSQGAVARPFQNLMFLIRDWAFPDDYDYGLFGGDDYLQKFLEIKENQKPVLKTVREHINGSFEKLSCSLLPHPGKTVSGRPKKGTKYNGNWGEMDEEFKEKFFTVIQHLLRKENLVPKKINGDYVKGAQFLQYILQYFELFQTDEIPRAQSIYESTIEQQMNIIINECFNNYKESIFRNQQFVNCEEMILVVHDMSKNQALLKYVGAKKMGNRDHESKFRKDLEKLIDGIYDEWKSQTTDSVEKIKKERERIRLELEEKLRLKEEQLESERIAHERLQELERLKHENYQKDEQYKYELKLAEERLKAEKERSEKILAEEKYSKLLSDKIAAEKRNAGKNFVERAFDCSIM